MGARSEMVNNYLSFNSFSFIYIIYILFLEKRNKVLTSRRHNLFKYYTNHKEILELKSKKFYLHIFLKKNNIIFIILLLDDQNSTCLG